MKFDYDLFVIGAGPGGIAAAKQASGYGIRVAIAEQDLVGGTCVIRGCIPEKLMSFAAEFSEESHNAEGYGWNNTSCTFDWQQFIRAKEAEIHRLSQVHTQALKTAGIELIKGCATFHNAHTLEVEGRHITADKILIAVGAKAVKPQIPGIDYTITSNELFNLPQQPQKIAIIGSNFIAVKLAGIMNNLGSQVALVIPTNSILEAFDEDIRLAVTEGLLQRDIQMINNSIVNEIQPLENELNLILSKQELNPLRVDTVLYATERIPDTSNLALGKVGVQVAKDVLVVDDYNQTTQANIFAVGDCINRLNFTPVAIAQGRAFADTQFGGTPHKVCYECVPVTLSSHPEAATVGLSEAEAHEKFGNSVQCYRSQFRPLLHSLAKRDEQTLVKLVVDSCSDRVLGVHMVGEGAIEIIQCLALAVRLGVTKKDFNTTIGIHPSVAEEFFALQ
ncbi:MAG TPA: glutathione-disulfide reductase [Stenomitos sp.]